VRHKQDQLLSLRCLYHVLAINVYQ
jgi:hypothetical protein